MAASSSPCYVARSFLLPGWAVPTASSSLRRLPPPRLRRKAVTSSSEYAISKCAISVYGVLYTRSTWVHLLSGGLTGFLWIQSGWMGHDFGHYTVMRTPALNRLAQVAFANCISGVSIAWWKHNHNAHHIARNSLEFDPNLQHLPLFTVSSQQFQSLRSYFSERKMDLDTVARFLVSYQHWTFYPVMCFARIDFMAQSILLLLPSKKKVPNRG